MAPLLFRDRPWLGRVEKRLFPRGVQMEIPVLVEGGRPLFIQQIFGRQRGRCFYCDEPLRKGFHADHIDPDKRGRFYVAKDPAIADNIVCACPACNVRKHDKSVAEYVVWRQKRGMYVSKAALEQAARAVQPGETHE